MTTDVKDRNSELVAKRWAKALMELVCEDENISKEDALHDLQSIAENIEASDELKTVVNNPSITTEEKQIVISKLFQDRIMPIVYNFIFALNLKKRLNIVPLITEEFKKELEEYKNIVKVNVTSAIEINDEKKDYIKNKLAEKLQKNIDISWGIDSEIIAGLIFDVNNTIFDNSIKNKLEKISKSIRG